MARQWFKGQPCWYCGEAAKNRDHVIPRVRGGAEVVKLVASCNWCNSHKSDMSVEEFRLWLRDKTMPRHQKAVPYQNIAANGFQFYGEIHSVVYVEGSAIKRSQFRLSEVLRATA